MSVAPDLNGDFYDISPEISERTAVFPGDTPFRRIGALSFERGDNLLLSSIQTSVHIGAHTDAPSHYHPNGAGISARPLRPYFGPCQVVSLKLARGERIRPVHLVGVSIQAPRILFKTGSFPDPIFWNDDFNSLSAELIEYLVTRKIILVGIDTPSVDPAQDQVLETHQAIFRHDLSILEGIVLSEVPDGVYTLVALPLKIRDADASPVRAILWKK